MTVYYNEIDPFACAWLRELIREGLIADGVVDERSIEDVTPTELAGFTQCHFFAGIGGWSYALRLAGWPDDRPVWTASCPCQPFSTAGKGDGFDDERHLWPAVDWLVEQSRPDTIFGEQVASDDGLFWLDLVSADLEGKAYTVASVDTGAASVGAPHIRQRLYWMAHARLHRDRQHAGKLPGDESQYVVGAARGDHASLGGGAARGVADADGPERRQIAARGGSGEQGNPGGREQASGRPGPDREADGLADTQGRGRGTGSRGDRADGRRAEPADHGGPGRLGDAAGAGRQGEQDGGRALRAQRPAAERAGSDAGGLANADRAGAARHRGDRWQAQADAGRLWLDPRARGGDGRPGPLNGFWRAADWLFCRDGSWRPVEPGTFPLAHGLSARVGRLRGYGNAINALQAAAFIRAYLDEEQDQGVLT